MDKVSLAKAVARKAAFAARKAARAPAAEALMQAHLRAALESRYHAPLAGYMPIRTEADPLPVMAAHGGPVGVPVIVGAGQALAFHRWAPGCEMAEGPFGARVPTDGVVVVPRVLIVPLLAFDARGYRLGYGGGFYDRTLAALRACAPVLALGLAFGAQEVPRVPNDAFDARLDGVVTEAGLRLFG